MALSLTLSQVWAGPRVETMKLNVNLRSSAGLSRLRTRLSSLLKSHEPVSFKDGNILCTLTTILSSQMGVFNCREKRGSEFQEDQVKSI